MIPQIEWKWLVQALFTSKVTKHDYKQIKTTFVLEVFLLAKVLNYSEDRMRKMISSEKLISQFQISVLSAWLFQ